MEDRIFFASELIEGESLASIIFTSPDHYS